MVFKKKYLKEKPEAGEEKPQEEDVKPPQKDEKLKEQILPKKVSFEKQDISTKLSATQVKSKIEPKKFDKHSREQGKTDKPSADQLLKKVKGEQS